MFVLRGVSKRYGERTAVAPLDLRLEADKTYVLIGPSGCGKSTLIKIMIGLVPPDSGKVFFGKEELTQESAAQLRMRVGYVIQDGGLFPHLTGEQNISLVARYLRWEPDRIRRRLQELATLTRFPYEALSRYPLQLSGGQRQRVSLMRALMLDPDVLLLDEPLGALDPMIRFGLQAELKEIFRCLHKTVVLVTHDLHEAAYLADEVLLVRDGRIVQQGRIQELVDAPADPFVTSFINAQRGALQAEA